MKVLHFISILTLLAVTTEAATNERPAITLGYTPKIEPWYIQPYSPYPNYVIPPFFNGYRFKTSTDVDNWVLVANSPTGPWKRFPWPLRANVTNEYTSFPWNILSSDKPTFFKLCQMPSPQSDYDLKYFDYSSRLITVTNPGVSWGEIFTDTAWWVTNRLYAGFTNSMGQPVWQSRGALDENSLPGATAMTYAAIFKPPYWITPTNPPVQPPATNATNVVSVPTNSNPNITYTVIGTNIYRQIRATNSDGSIIILGSNVGTGGNGTGTETGGDGTGNQPPNIPPDPNYNPTGPPGSAEVTGGIDSIVDNSFSTAGFARFALAMQNNPSPKYRSSGPETNEWSGVIKVPTNGAVGLYVRSDDGCTVMINGAVVHDDFNSDTHWNEPLSSLFFLGCLPAGSVNNITVRYSNTQHTANDVDGISLYTVGDYDQARVSGPSMVYFFGADGSDEYTFRWNGHGSTPLWETSGNLRPVRTNDQMQTLTVVATGPSSGYWDTWVEAWAHNACSGEYKTARYYLTVLQPSAVQNAGVVRSSTANRVTSVYSYQLLDQFGSPFTSPCLVTEQTWAVSGNNLIVGTLILPDHRNVRVTGGKFTDTLSAQRGNAGFTRGQAIWAHRTQDGQGPIVRLNYLYFFVGDPTSIDAVPAGTPR